MDDDDAITLLRFDEFEHSDDFYYDYKQLANPYEEEIRECLEDCPDDTGPDSWTPGVQNTRQFVHEDESLGDTLRITTRARQTYELYRYDKNAMLILSQQDDREAAGDLMERVKTTFQEFKFEVEVYFASNPNDMYAKCGQFFQSDFQDYGAVALAIVTSMGVNRSNRGLYRPDGMFFHESTVLQNFEAGHNPTLLSKPKIYITLDDRAYGRDTHAPRLVRETYGDILAMHVPLRAADLIGADFGGVGVHNFMLKNKFRRGGPLDLLCDKMAARWENDDMASIMKKTAEEYARSDVTRSNLLQIPVTSTLDRQLFFERAVNYFDAFVLLLFALFGIVTGIVSVT